MKKILSVMLSMAMLLSSVSISVSAEEYNVPTLDISQIENGVSIFEQNFDDKTVGDTMTKSMGFSDVIYNGSDSNLRNAKYEVTEGINGNTTKSIYTKPNIMYMHAATYADKFENVSKNVTLSGTQYKVLDYDFDGDTDTSDETYYLAYNSGATDLYWIKKDSVDSDNTASSGGKWFYVDQNDSTKITGVYEGNSVQGAYMNFPKPSTSELVGTIAYQFDFTYKAHSYTYGGEEGFNLKVDDKQFYIRDNCIKSNDDNVSLSVGDGKTEIIKNQKMNIYVPKTSAASQYVKASEVSTYIQQQAKLAEGGVWHKLMVKFNCIDNEYTFYYDGLPLYFPTTSGNYGCVFKMSGTDYQVGLYTNRMCVYADNAPYFDNFKGVYAVHSVKGLDVKEISGGTKFFGQNFDDSSIVEGTRITSDMGFVSVNDTNDVANVRYIVAHDDITDVSETSNRVMALKPNRMLVRATDDQWAAMQSSNKTVKSGTATYYVTDMNSDYYMGATARNAMMYWFKKTSVSSDGTVSGSDNIDYGKWFDLSGDTMTYSSNSLGTSLTFPKPGEGAGKYAIQFDFEYPDNFSGWSPIGEEGFDVTIDGYQFHVRQYGIKRSGDPKDLKLCFGDTTKTETKDQTAAMVPKISLDIPYYFTESAEVSANLTQISSFYNNKEWHKFMVYVDNDGKFYTLYYDGLPVYFKAEDGTYSCRISWKGTSLSNFSLGTQRYCIYSDHRPVFDNFLGYETSGTDQDIVDRRANSIVMPYINTDVITTDILFDKNENETVKSWSFSNDTFVFDSQNELIARNNAPYGRGTSKVTLTAMCEYNGKTAVKTFDLTVKDRTPYEIDTVLMKDSDGNRIYRPLEGAKIESVSYTKVKSDAPDAQLYLAIYDSDGRLINGICGTPSDGEVVFNAAINPGETYKVFVWDNGLHPLAEQRKSEASESNGTPKIFVIGDSIAQTYSSSSNLVGFGQRLNTIFNGVTVNNSQAVGGRTTKYALAENRLKYVLDNASEGDYLFVSLGHNDEKIGDYYGATIEEYKMILTQMVDAVRSKGVETVLLTPVARPYPDNDSHKNYSDAMLEVAKATGTPVFDIDELTKVAVWGKSTDEIKALGYYNYPGDTHLVSAGADWVVGIIGNELRKSNHPLSDYLK